MDAVDTTNSSTGVGMLESSAAPVIIGLHQNYLNPFNPSTTISFTIAKTSNVILKIYDSLGREVRTLLDESLSSGNYSVTFDGQNLTIGIYFLQLKARSYIETKKLVLLI